MKCLLRKMEFEEGHLHMPRTAMDFSYFLHCYLVITTILLSRYNKDCFLMTTN